ncbi:hypothetical protein MicloDRAFT_00034680 [Microvirga lotononidis]|uniref:Uncharacterized protein n=1 Tax=Microvirga lotononidis TaxID=864069 RepID=I4YSH4_9HYPH|nr:hypothetical protein MicloDRAFT_00034680 [Microvirga lotononidis]
MLISDCPPAKLAVTPYVTPRLPATGEAARENV